MEHVKDVYLNVIKTIFITLNDNDLKFSGRVI